MSRIVILSTADWDSPVWTNKQHLALQLAQEFEVLYIESLGLRRPELGTRDFRRLVSRLRSRSDPSGSNEPTIPLLSPLAVPFHGLSAARAVNRRWLNRAWRDLATFDVLWAFSPITYGLEERARMVVYHAVDLLSELPHMPQRLILQRERELARAGAVAVASSTGVRDHLLDQGFSEVALWENVADSALYAAATLPGERAMDRVIFSGNLTDIKVDRSILMALAAESRIDLHLAGPLSEGGGSSAFVAALQRAGVTYHGVLRPVDLATLVASSRVAVIPYAENSYTRGVFPMKLWEYLAAGCAVVTTPLPSLAGSAGRGLFVQAKPSGFVPAVLEQLVGFDVGEARFRTQEALTHSWENRGREARHLVRSRLSEADAHSDQSVVFVINSSTFGGAHNQLLAAVPVLRERGLRPVALLPAEPGSAPDRLRCGGVTVTQLPLLRPRAGSGPGALAALAYRYPGQVKQIAEFLIDERAAFVQLHGLLTLDAAWAARRAEVPIVWQLIDTRPPWALRRLLTPLVRSMATLTMSAGVTVADHYPGLGDSETHLCFLPPVNHSMAALDRARDQRGAARSRLGISAEHRLIGALGNFNRQKGLEVLLDVVPKLMKDPAVRVRIRGAAHDADYRAELEGQIANLPSEIVNIGELEVGLQALDFLAALDLLVVPSVGRSEGIPTVVLEAIALGTPVVASDVGGIREILTDGETGWLFTAGSRTELRTAIDRTNEPGIGSAVARAALIHLHHVEARMGFDAVHRDAYDRLVATSVRR